MEKSKCQQLLDCFKNNVEAVGSEEELKKLYSAGYKKLMNSIDGCVEELILEKTEPLYIPKKLGEVVKEIRAMEEPSIQEAIRTFDEKNVKNAIEDFYFDIVNILSNEYIQRVRWNEMDEKNKKKSPEKGAVK